METLLQVLISHEEFLTNLDDLLHEKATVTEIKNTILAEYNHNRGMIEMIKTLLTDIDIPIKDI